MLSGIRYYLRSLPTIIRGVKNPIAAAGLIFSNPKSVRLIQLTAGLKFYVRTLMDLWILKETCLDHQYEVYGAPIQDGWTVVDIGGGWGDFAISIGKNNPNCRVLAFEPFPPSMELFEKNVGINQVSNVRLVKSAVGKHTGTMHLSSAKREAVQISTADRPSADGIEVSSLSLEDALATGEISQCDFLKMDCEGGEYDILFSANQATLEIIHRICMETHDGVTQFNHRDIICFLEIMGFLVRFEVNPVHANLGMLYAERNEATISGSAK